MASWDDFYPTETTYDQAEVEDDIKQILAKLFRESNKSLLLLDSKLRLNRDRHIKYLLDSLDYLPPAFCVLDSSQSWICLWIHNSLEILGYQFTEGDVKRLLSRISEFKLDSPHSLDDDNSDRGSVISGGGYNGGFMQLPHLVSCFAAIMSLVLVGDTPGVLDSIDRKKMYEWFMELKQPDGSFLAHKGGEIDVRGSYCVLVIGSLLNILTEELVENVAEYIASCQSLEGGIGPRPGIEAHGGYTLCGLAALEILGRTDMLDLRNLTKWLCARQMTIEGGFNGRTNKLVDGCYSYWVGGCFPLLQSALGRSPNQDHLYDRGALQRYILACCQNTKTNKEGTKKGGLLDKPGKSADLYHTMYCLTGLSLSQNYVLPDNTNTAAEPIHDIKTKLADIPKRMVSWRVYEHQEYVLGDHEINKVAPVHPIYNVPLEKVRNCFNHFYLADSFE